MLTAAEVAPAPGSMAPSTAAFSHPMTAAHAIAVAATEGLILERANSASGFRFVQTLRDSYPVQLFHNGAVHSLGSFPTPEEAALCVARWKRDHPAADTALAAATYVQTVSEEAATGTVAEADTMGGIGCAAPRAALSAASLDSAWPCNALELAALSESLFAVDR